jgi:hypothetical protein
VLPSIFWCATLELVGDKEGEYTKDDVTRLVEWSNQIRSPCTKNIAIKPFKKNKATAIHLIDHPEWVSKVDFNLGLGSVAKASEG